MLWMCPVQTGVDLAEVINFYKFEKTSSQTVLPIKIKNVELLYIIMAA